MESSTEGQIPAVEVKKISTNPAGVSGVVMVYWVFNEFGEITDPNQVLDHVLENPDVTVPERSSKLKFAQILSPDVIVTSGASKNVI